MEYDGKLQAGAMPAKAQDKKVDGILQEIRKRLEMCIAAESKNHVDGLDDLRFLNGDQWPEKQRRNREIDGRPCLTINKLPTFLQQVTNDQRQNRASIKVSAVGVHTKSKTAELVQGMIRHMEYVSSADVAYDTAVNSAAAIGFGYFRLITEYCQEDSFDQELKFKRIRNPFTVYFDPASTEPDGSDATFVIITEKMTKEEFKSQYPKATVTTSQFESVSVGDGYRKDWIWENMVRVAEYYRMEYSTETLCLLSDGTTKWKADKSEYKPGQTIVKERESVRRKVMWYMLTPYEVLEEVEVKCKWIPVFPVYGTEIDIDGVVHRSGMIRNAKDPAMMYNFWMTSATEEVALRPKTPYIGAVGQFKGQEKRWNTANNRSYSMLEYNMVALEGQLAPPPIRQPMADVPVGILTMAEHASDNIKSTTGLFDSSLGAAGNATSGKQEIAQQKQGNVANFHYTDNLTRTLRHAGRCIIYMIPHYYDTDRMVRTMGEDGKIKSEYINRYNLAAQEFVNDVRTGEFDVAVSVGPSYATMRAEAAEAMVQFGQSWPKLMDIAGDKVVMAMNWPGAEEIAGRIERTIPKEIRYDPKEPELDENGQPVPMIPPEAQQQIMQLQQEIEELQKEADKNNAAVTVAQIRKEAQIAVAEAMSKGKMEVAHITDEGKLEVTELRGSIDILIKKMDAMAAQQVALTNKEAKMQSTALTTAAALESKENESAGAEE